MSHRPQVVSDRASSRLLGTDPSRGAFSSRSDPDSLNVREFPNTELREFATVAALLHTAERKPWVRSDHAVDEHVTGGYIASEYFRALNIGGPDCGAETV